MSLELLVFLTLTHYLAGLLGAALHAWHTQGVPGARKSGRDKCHDRRSRPSMRDWA